MTDKIYTPVKKMYEKTVFKLISIPENLTYPEIESIIQTEINYLEKNGFKVKNIVKNDKDSYCLILKR